MHRHNRRPARSWLHGIDYDALMGSRAGSGAPSGQRATPGPPGQCRDEVLAGYLSEARAQAEVAGSQFRYGSTSLAAAAVLPAEAEELRWFLMPAEALQLLHQGGGHELGGAAWRAPFVARGFGAASGQGCAAPRRRRARGVRLLLAGRTTRGRVPSWTRTSPSLPCSCRGRRRRRS
ncbi:unnamed protein product, partial [Prorocentrum cordatum]